MDLRDFIVTPIVIMMVYAVAWFLRPRMCDEVTYPYFFPSLTIRIVGALLLGMLYQFYYGGGDTFNFHTHGSRQIWEAFTDSAEKGLKLFFKPGEYTGVYEYASKIPFFRDSQSYAIIRIAAIFDLFTFSTYSATAVLFSVVSFFGSWLMFKTFYRIRPSLHRQLAVVTLFVPSVVFWGSGILKDTITLACLGVATWSIYNLFIREQIRLGYMLALVISIYFMLVIKIYILLAFLPSAIVWIFFYHFSRIRSVVLKLIVTPFVIAISIWLGYYATVVAGAANPKYALSTLATTAQVTAYDIRFWTGRDAGSGYTLGELDGSWQSMFALAPQSINVSLFRPYLWEVQNPLMLFSAVESFALLVFTLFVIATRRLQIFKALSDPTILFCLMFSLTFAFAVGVSTFNFGTLSRYKIPLLPFFLAALLLIYYWKSDKKLAALETTE